MKFEKGKIFNANELVDYTDGGVVSKEFIRGTGTFATHCTFRCVYSSYRWRDGTQCGGYRQPH